MASAAGLASFTEIAVIRHGETSWNASRILQGQLDSELNENGRRQATAVAFRLSKEPKFVAIYSSDLKRAAETANIIADICAFPEVILDSALRERHLGDLQGFNLHDAKKLKPEAYNAFLSSKREGRIPGGGESLDQLNERCVSCLEKIACKHKGERVIVVTHGGVLRELRKHAVSSQTRDRKIHNASVSLFLISESGDWTVKTWGDTSHLQEIKILDNAFGGDGTSG